MAEKHFFIPDWPRATMMPSGEGGWSISTDEGEIRYAQAVRIDDVIHVAGQVAWNRNGEVIGKDDLLIQSRQVFKNIAEVLDLAGATLNDVVKMVMYFTDMSDIRAFRQARREYMPGVACITTGVQVAGMTQPDLLLEVEVTAAL